MLARTGHTGSVWGEVKVGTVLLLADFWGLTWPLPVSSHFTHFLCTTGALSAAVLVVVPRVGGFVCSSALLRNWQFLPQPQPPPWVYSTFFFWHWSPGLRSLDWDWARLLTRCLLEFYPHVNMGWIKGLPVPSVTIALLPLCTDSLSLPILPVWMYVASINPWLLDFCTVLGVFHF